MESKNGYTCIKCNNCGNEFLCQNFRIAQHKHLFCCKKCEGEYRKNHNELNCKCENCGKLFHLKPSQKAKIKHLACCKECSLELRRKYYSGKYNHQFGLKGNLNSSWKSDERISVYGYRLIRCLDHPFKNSDDFVFEHRLVAEKYLLTDETSVTINNKQYLSPNFIVHHIDFNRLNNNVENLCIMDISDHAKFHTLYKSLKNGKRIPQEKVIEYDEIVEKYNLPYTTLENITDDDNADGVRNGGFGSTDK